MLKAVESNCGRQNYLAKFLESKNLGEGEGSMVQPNLNKSWKLNWLGYQFQTGKLLDIWGVGPVEGG